MEGPHKEEQKCECVNAIHDRYTRLWLSLRLFFVVVFAKRKQDNNFIPVFNPAVLCSRFRLVELAPAAIPARREIAGRWVETAA